MDIRGEAPTSIGDQTYKGIWERHPSTHTGGSVWILASTRPALGESMGREPSTHQALHPIYICFAYACCLQRFSSDHFIRVP